MIGAFVASGTSDQLAPLECSIFPQQLPLLTASLDPAIHTFEGEVPQTARGTAGLPNGVVAGSPNPLGTLDQLVPS
ncbi:MAG: hypothetical protein M3P12_09415 [Gemmatimonadota bacterium]|nr:hypothetical protein [Gemmatimonadota bacterium]